MQALPVRAALRFATGRKHGCESANCHQGMARPRPLAARDSDLRRAFGEVCCSSALQREVAGNLFFFPFFVAVSKRFE